MDKSQDYRQISEKPSEIVQTGAFLWAEAGNLLIKKADITSDASPFSFMCYFPSGLVAIGVVVIATASGIVITAAGA